VIAAIDAEHIDDRGYRAAQLEAGLIDGRFRLAATALRLAATGLTFLDSEIPTLLRERLAGLLLTGVGTSALPPPARRTTGLSHDDAPPPDHSAAVLTAPAPSPMGVSLTPGLRA